MAKQRKLILVTPAPRGSWRGNRVSAVRYARLLGELGYRVEITEEFENQSADGMVALHARRSADSIARFSDRHPDDPLIVVLTGTDLYGDIQHSAVAKRSLALADRLVLLQPLGKKELPPAVRSKAVVIIQSARAPRGVARAKRSFAVSVLGHLRPVKDPFRAALAVRNLPDESRISVEHMGAPMTDKDAARARAETKSNARYQWVGELPRWRALRRLARSHAMVLSSRSEGGANVVSEAIAAGVPVIASDIPGSVGLLGRDYPAYFPVGDTDRLRDLLLRTESDAAFRKKLERHIQGLRVAVLPKTELAAWRRLLQQLHRLG